jgi:hypothetical protein
MAGILLTRKKIHLILKELGHEPTKQVFEGGKDTIKSLIWKTPWGTFFPVPDEDLAIGTWVLSDILSDIDQTRPETKKPAK